MKDQHDINTRGLILSSEYAMHTKHDAFKTFRLGDRVRKISGAEWEGTVVGWYSTELTPEGYAVESEAHRGSVQIYPAKALVLVEHAR